MKDERNPIQCMWSISPIYNTCIEAEMKDGTASIARIAPDETTVEAVEHIVAINNEWVKNNPRAPTG